MKSQKGVILLVGLYILATAAVAGTVVGAAFIDLSAAKDKPQLAAADPNLSSSEPPAVLVVGANHAPAVESVKAPAVEKTRAQVQEDFSVAQRTGDMPASEFESMAVGFQPGLMLNQVYPNRFALKRAADAPAPILTLGN